MPEGKENNCLDREELQGRVIRPQKLLGGRVEEEESKEGDRDADVVDEGGVEVTFSHIPPALMIFSPSLKNDDNYAEDRLEEAELESPLLAKPEEANVVTLPSQATCASDKTGPYILSPDLGHDVPFPAKVFVAQGEEVVDNKGL